MHPIKHIGRYTIITKIGYGGMSSVFRALDPQSGNDVAIKFLQDNLANNASSKLRFEQEAKLLLGVRHPAIVPILDFGEEAGRMYLVMPYMPNDSLNNRLANGRLPLDEVIPILERVAAALDEAHTHNIIHRDIKPQNILLDSSGAAYLSDFGVARLLDGDQPEKTMTLIGTPDYMAPEQINEGNLSPQTDIYQLGVTLFKMLTGTTPYKGSIHNLMTQHLQAPIPSAESLNRSLPAGCDAVLRKAMAKSPNQRFASASDLVAALEQVRTADAVGTMSLAPPTLIPVTKQVPQREARVVAQKRRSKRARPLLVGSMIGLALVGLLTAGVLATGIQFNFSSAASVEQAEPIGIQASTIVESPASTSEQEANIESSSVTGTIGDSGDELYNAENSAVSGDEIDTSEEAIVPNTSADEEVKEPSTTSSVRTEDEIVSASPSDGPPPPPQIRHDDGGNGGNDQQRRPPPDGDGHGDAPPRGGPPSPPRRP